MLRRHRHLTRRIVKSLCCYCCSLSGSLSVRRKMFSSFNKRRKSWRELDVFTASSCSRELLFAILVSRWLSVVK